MIPQLRILKTRLESLNIKCVEDLPKNYKIQWKLRFIILDHTVNRVGDDDNAFDMTETHLPDTIHSAKEAWFNFRDDGNRYIVTLYTKA